MENAGIELVLAILVVALVMVAAIAAQRYDERTRRAQRRLVAGDDDPMDEPWPLEPPGPRPAKQIRQAEAFRTDFHGGP